MRGTVPLCRALRRQALAVAMAGAVITLCLILTGSPACAGEIVLAGYEGVINPVAAEYLHDALAFAHSSGAQALIFKLDTPGGLDTSMRLMIKDMTAMVRKSNWSGWGAGSSCRPHAGRSLRHVAARHTHASAGAIALRIELLDAGPDPLDGERYQEIDFVRVRAQPAVEREHRDAVHDRPHIIGQLQRVVISQEALALLPGDGVHQRLKRAGAFHCQVGIAAGRIECGAEHHAVV